MIICMVCGTQCFEISERHFAVCDECWPEWMENQADAAGSDGPQCDE